MRILLNAYSFTLENLLDGCPGPDRSVRLAQLRAGRAIPRRYRNRRIGEFLKELDMTEGRSTGIPKILQAMKRNGSPKPEFDFDDDHTFFMCRLPVHPQATMPKGLALHVAGQVKGPQPESGAQSGVQRLLDDALVEYTLPDKPNSRLQKYRLTPKGHTTLQNFRTRAL